MVYDLLFLESSTHYSVIFVIVPMACVIDFPKSSRLFACELPKAMFNQMVDYRLADRSPAL
jgi:hypothetical protein